MTTESQDLSLTSHPKDGTEGLNFLCCHRWYSLCLAFLTCVCSPCQVLGDVYTEVLEAVHPLHRGPTDHKRSVGPLLSLPGVYNQLFSFAHVQRETVVLAP